MVQSPSVPFFFLVVTVAKGKETVASLESQRPGWVDGRLLATCCWSRGKLAHFSGQNTTITDRPGETNSSESVPWTAETTSQPTCSPQPESEQTVNRAGAGAGMADRWTARLLRA